MIYSRSIIPIKRRISIKWIFFDWIKIFRIIKCFCLLSNMCFPCYRVPIRRIDFASLRLSPKFNVFLSVLKILPVGIVNLVNIEPLGLFLNIWVFILVLEDLNSFIELLKCPLVYI